MRKSYNTDIAKEVKEQRKILPYTVTPIANLAAWKAEQAEKQAKWDAGRGERYASARQRAVEVLQGTRTPSASVHTLPGEAAAVARLNKPRSTKTSVKNDTKSQVTQQISLVRRLFNWCLNSFLDISY